MLTVTGARAAMIDRNTTVGDTTVACDAGRIVDPAAVAGAAETLDASGCVITPGLINAHHHLLQTAFRTLPGTKAVPMATWLPRMADAYRAVGVDPELAFAAAAAGIAESLLCGVTTVADHHLTWPAGGDSVAIAAATRDAAGGLGARLVFVRGSAGDDPQVAAASAESILQELIPTGGGVSTDGMVQVAVGPAGVHSDGRETFELLAEVARRYGLRRRTQANEVVDVAVAAQRYGRRPLEVLDEWGWLAPDVTLAHLCGVTPAEIGLLAERGVAATHAPGCDLPMGWGVAPFAALSDAGVSVGLGTSGGGSNDAGHLLADARLALQVAPLVGRPMSAVEVIAAATSGSATGLGRPELGHLRPGAAADFCLWDTTGVADAGVADPVSGLLWAAPGRRPRHVLVAGQFVVRDWQLVRGDERQIVDRLAGLLAARAVQGTGGRR